MYYHSISFGCNVSDIGEERQFNLIEAIKIVYMQGYYKVIFSNVIQQLKRIHTKSYRTKCMYAILSRKGKHPVSE